MKLASFIKVKIELEATKNDIEQCSVRLANAKSKLAKIESELSELTQQQQEKRQDIAKRKELSKYIKVRELAFFILFSRQAI
ncbi:MAG: hypothetical protein MZU97_02735 [Bacillus subtilis]|nr:hypothetical protein [Bacillus subtilis]